MLAEYASPRRPAPAGSSCLLPALPLQYLLRPARDLSHQVPHLGVDWVEVRLDPVRLKLLGSDWADRGYDGSRAKRLPKRVRPFPGCYVERPAQADSTRPPASPGVTAQRAGVDPLVPASVSAMLVARNLFPTGNATTVTGEPSL
jgi:hypothetical protein